MIKYNVGCGWRNFGEDWFHVDGGNYPHVQSNDVFLKGTPNNTVDLIYSSHLIAYFTREQLKELLACWYNALKPGGTLQIATPDFKRLSFMYNAGRCQLKAILGPLYGIMKMNGETIQHKTVWDYDDLEKECTASGFVNFNIYDHKKTCHPNTGNREDKYDDHSAAFINGSLISLNVEAKKPL